MSVEWGAASSRRRDVVIGGLAGVVLAGSWTALMSLLVVAGAVGRLHAAHPVDVATATPTPVLSFRWAVANGVGGAAAAVILILFGLGRAGAGLLLVVRLHPEALRALAKGPPDRLGLDRLHRGVRPGGDRMAGAAGGGGPRHGAGVRPGGRRDSG